MKALILRKNANATASCAQALIDKGFEVVEIRMCEMRDSDLRDELELADLVLVGAPTINRDAPPQVWHALSLFSLVTPKAKVAGVFGSFGWSGEAPERIYGTMENIFKMKMVKEPLMLKSSALGGGLQMAQDYGRDIAKKIA